VSPYRSRNAFASSVRPSASSASAVTRALSLVQAWFRPEAASWVACALRDGQTLRGAPGFQQQARVIARILLRQRVVAAEHLLADCDSLLEQRLGFIGVSDIPQCPCEIAHARSCVAMLWAEHLFVYGQRTLVERPRPSKIALVVQQVGQVAEAQRGFGMVGAERLLGYRQRAFVERPRPLKILLQPK